MKTYLSTNTQRPENRLNEDIGRAALLDMFQKKGVDLDIKFTTNDWDSYDASWIYTNSCGQVRTAIVEIKIRYATYRDYILQPSKRQGMEDHAIRDGHHDMSTTSFFYINFCPEGSYLWDITNVDAGRAKKTMCNKDNGGGRGGKILRSTSTIMLKPSEGADLNYVMNKQDMLDKMRQQNN
jgi:hypothetical protein